MMRDRTLNSFNENSKKHPLNELLATANKPNSHDNHQVVLIPTNNKW